MLIIYRSKQYEIDIQNTYIYYYCCWHLCERMQERFLALRHLSDTFRTVCEKIRRWHRRCNQIYNGLGNGGFQEQMLSSVTDESLFTIKQRIDLVNTGINNLQI
ncbi:hypothetical protein CS542_05825 [Pedobacter sp. IW39]|nr:hypothetical protein CS542_05825 [Pedobacter sp. IW39]